MKRNNILLIFGTLILLTISSCSKTEEFQTNSDSVLQIESVSGISTFALMQEPASKAVITGNTLPDSDAAMGVGIFVSESDGSAYDGHANGYTNVKFANSGSGWSTSNPVYLSDTEGKLHGYFPYNSSANDLRVIPVASSLNGTDYLYADTQTVNHSNKSVSLTMSHALSRLHLTIKKGANFTASAPLSKITLTSTAIDATGTMDLTTGTVTASKKSGETGTVELVTDGEITAEGIEKDILLVPADNSNGKKGISISLMIAGKPAGITIPAENGLDIRSGIQNNVILTIEDTGIKVTGVGIGVWGEGGGQRVQAGAHVVTVKFADEQNIEKDVFVMTNIDGDVVKIEAIAKSDNALGYSVTGKATCSRTKTGSFYVFTISGISSDVTVEIGYKVAVENITLDRTSVNPAQGWNVHLLPEVSPADATTKGVTWSSNNSDIASVDAYGNVTAIAQGEATITATAKDGSGVTASCIITVGPAISGSLTHEFSVSATKKVHFSKGNLYADGDKALHFEANQYSFASSWDASHVSHFTWSSTVEAAVGNSNSGSNLFCDEGHKVSVDGGEAIYYALSKDEWTCLFNNHSYKWASVNGVFGYVIAPDGFSGELANSYADDAALAADNLVFLPVSGYRDGSNVFNVGGEGNGYYWSSTAYDNYAYSVNFNGIKVKLDYQNGRKSGSSVRLITESK